jgi:hypothetical protein
MWFIGVLIGFVAILGMRLDGRLVRRDAARLLAVPVISLVVAGLTPVGPKLLFAPLATSGMAPFVTEWQPPDFSELPPAAAALMVAIVMGAWARRGGASWTELLLLASAVGWMLLYARTVAVGAVIAAPLFAGVIQSFLPMGRTGSRRGERVTVWAVACLACIGLALLVRQGDQAPLERVNRINAELGQLPEGTVVFNDYALGGWLEWRHRNVDPVVDGMTDAFEVDYMSDYVSARRLEPGWHAFLTRTGADYALLDREAAMSAVLTERDDWTLVVVEGDLALFKLAGQ